MFDEPTIAAAGIPKAYVEAETKRQLHEIERRRHTYLGDPPMIPTRGRNVIVVDDGIATGGTVKGALKALRRTGAKHTILAVPVAPPEAPRQLRREVYEIVCLNTPTPFLAVGLHYRDFDQTTDAEVIDLLERSRSTSVR